MFTTAHIHLLTLADNVYSTPQPRSAEPTGSSVATTNGSSVTVPKEDDVGTDSTDEFPSGAAAPSTVATMTKSVSMMLQHEKTCEGQVPKHHPNRQMPAIPTLALTNTPKCVTANDNSMMLAGCRTWCASQSGPGPMGTSSDCH